MRLPIGAMPVLVVVNVVMIVVVVVVMPVERQRPARASPEQCPVLRGRGHVLRLTLATDMPVQTDHPVRGAHDHVQFMTDHQHSAAGFTPHPLGCLDAGLPVSKPHRRGFRPYSQLSGRRRTIP